MRRLRVPEIDPQALRDAARAGLVVPAMLAFGEFVIGNSIVALLAAFASFAVLVFAQFGGPRRNRLLAYVGLTASGFPLIALGTLCSGHVWIGGATMAVIAFAILFAGVVSPYVAAGSSSALLAFVVAALVPGTAGDIPERLAGWGLGATVSVLAVMLLWPSSPRDRLSASIAAACRALADGVEGKKTSDQIREAVTEVRRVFEATPHRPTGASGASAALAFLVNHVSWLWPFAKPPREATAAFPQEAGAIRGAAVSVLRGAAARLEGRDEAPVDLRGLEAAGEESRPAFARVADPSIAPDDDALAHALEEAYGLRQIAFSARQIGVQALAASGAPSPDPDELGRYPAGPGYESPGEAARAAGRLARGYASTRSVWFRNSLRAAVGLGIAIVVSNLSDVQHGFWVVLGTMAVLRSSALGTGSTILRALGGTLVGITVAGAVIELVGSDANVLWAIFPFAVLLASYAPGVSFAAGQAGFTVAILILFELIEPSGWQIGLLRVEDIAIGGAISLVVGLLFWPRGAAAVVRHSVAAGYAAGTEYLAHATRTRLDGDGDRGEPLERAGAEALAANRRLDDAFRQYLSERATAHDQLGSLTALAAGSSRVLRIGRLFETGHPPWRLGPPAGRPPELVEHRRGLDAEVEAIQSWFAALGETLVADAPAPAPEDAAGAPMELLRFARTAAAAGREQDAHGALALAWTHAHLDVLRSVEPLLAEAAAGLAGGSARPGERAPGR